VRRKSKCNQLDQTIQAEIQDGADWTSICRQYCSTIQLQSIAHLSLEDSPFHTYPVNKSQINIYFCNLVQEMCLH